MKKHMWVILLITMIFTVVFSKDITNGIRESVDLCIYTVIPSLFPFLVLSGMMTMSGSAEYMGKIIHPLTKKMFLTSENGSFLFVTGILCGYPVGAKCISDMIKDRKISTEEGKRLILFCNNSGPLFVIGAVGYGMFSDIKYGTILYISHILSAIVIGIATRRDTVSYSKYHTDTNTPYFTRSVENSVITVLNICGYIIFFSAICTIINDIIPTDLKILRLAVCSLTEVTCAIKNISDMYSLTLQLKLIITSFLLGFGGICVLFQTKSVISGSGLTVLPFVYAKICQGALSSLFTYMIICFYPLRCCSHSVQSGADFSDCMLVISAVLMIIYFIKLLKKCNINKEY